MKIKTLTITTLVTFSLAGLASAEGEKCHKKRKLSPEKKAELLALYDEDGDGKLNEAEREKARSARRAKILEKFDSNGDGELNEEEKKKARAARKQRDGKKGKKGKRGKDSDSV